jgi:hypothetical protein
VLVDDDRGADIGDLGAVRQPVDHERLQRVGAGHGQPALGSKFAQDRARVADRTAAPDAAAEGQHLADEDHQEDDSDPFDVETGRALHVEGARQPGQSTTENEVIDEDSLGIWAFGGMATRFNPDAYKPELAGTDGESCHQASVAASVQSAASAARALAAMSAFVFAWPWMPQPPSGDSVIRTQVRSA